MGLRRNRIAHFAASFLPGRFVAGQAERSARQSAALLSLVQRKLTGTADFTQEIQFITEISAQTMKVERVGIWLYDDDGLVVRNVDLYERSRKRHGEDRTIRAIEYPQYFRALEEERAIAADDAQGDPRTSEYLHGYLLPKGITSMLDAPIRARGKVVGVLCFESVGRKRRWTPDELQFASSVADIAAVKLETFELLKTREELQYRLSFEQLLLSVANKFINAPIQNIRGTINEALRTLGQFVGVDRVYTYRFDPDGQTISNTNEWCAPGIDHKIHERQRLPVTSFPYTIAKIRRGETVFIPDFDSLPKEAEIDKRYFNYFGVVSLVWVPLMEEGKPFGFAGFTSATGKKAWTPESVALLKLVGATLVNMYARERASQERERAVEERYEMEQRMQQAQKLESLGMLAGGIAHDFNNLLMGMLGNAALLLLELPKESRARDRLEQIKRTAERAAELTNQLLAYAGKGSFATAPVNLGEVIEELIEMLGPMISPRARVSLALSTRLAPLEGDATHLRQVLMNLITNASDALGENSGEITIKTGSRYFSEEELRRGQTGAPLPAGNYVFVEVADTGCGIAPENLQRMFDPFFTTKSTGRGLGLAAVHGIIRGHRGTVLVESELGRGTTFRVLFPEPERVPGTAPVEERTETDLPITGAMLVIDDEELSRAVIEEMLQQLGCDVLTAASGEEGIEIAKARSEAICGVLLDMTMPGLDGIETLETLQKVLPDVPVFFMSGYSEKDAMANFTGSGVAGFLQKPFGPLAIREKIEELLEAKRNTDRSRPRTLYLVGSGKN